MAIKDIMETLVYKEPGYCPLVISDGWQAAVLNWEPGAQVSAINKVEQHRSTDELFILFKGKAALVVTDSDGLHVIEAAHGVFYNIFKGQWHTVIGNQLSSWIIVENKNTHLHDTTYRAMLPDELKSFHQQLPEWAK